MNTEKKEYSNYLFSNISEKDIEELKEFNSFKQ